MLTILAATFLLRVVGIGYGLPLTVVADEPPFTLAALKMLQLHTLIPAQHEQEFSTILYYPPYLSYILLLPFLGIVGLKYALWSGPIASFSATLISDLSPFFLVARLVSVLSAVLSIYLIYRIAESLFSSRVVAMLSAFLLSTSILHIALSMVGRHWVPASLLFLLVLYVLTRQWTLRRRYISALVIAGIGMGITTICILALPLIGLYYLFFDARSFRESIRDIPLGIFGFAIFTALAAIPSLLSNSSNHIVESIAFLAEKTVLGFLQSPFSNLALNIFSEPVFVGAFLVGLALLVWQRQRISYLILLFFVVYTVCFYVFFRFDARFLLPLLPLYALAGGYALARLWETRARPLVLLLLLVPTVAALRLDVLALQNDTRAHVREWALENLTPADKVLVHTASLRIPTRPEAIAELRALDPAAVRKTDEADEVLARSDLPYVLNNLVTLRFETLRTLPDYAKKYGYTHLVYSSQFADATSTAFFAEFTKDLPVVERFDGFDITTSLADSAFYDPLQHLFEDRTLGPTIVIYKLDL